jgi:hypothetical protein
MAAVVPPPVPLIAEIEHDVDELFGNGHAAVAGDALDLHQVAGLLAEPRRERRVDASAPCAS